jgi:transposase
MKQKRIMTELRATHSYLEISKKLNVNPGTVWNVLKRYENNGNKLIC